MLAKLGSNQIWQAWGIYFLLRQKTRSSVNREGWVRTWCIEGRREVFEQLTKELSNKVGESYSAVWKAQGSIWTLALSFSCHQSGQFLQQECTDPVQDFKKISGWITLWQGWNGGQSRGPQNQRYCLGSIVKSIESPLDGEGSEAVGGCEQEGVTRQHIMMKSQRHVLWEQSHGKARGYKAMIRV